MFKKEVKKMNEDVLKKIKKNPTVIQGFPGFGLIGSIVTEFLIGHLSCEKLDNHFFDELPPNLAIHNGKIVEPIGIYYNERFNIVILHSLVSPQGLEWKISDFIFNICFKVKAKELICIEGVGSGEKVQDRTFFFTTSNDRCEELKAKGLQKLEEGIILGVTSALMLKKKIPVTCIFGEAHSEIPDNNAAANIILTLDKILGLDVDPEPLKENAKLFELKFKEIMEKMNSALDEKDKKALSYVG